MKTNKGDNMVQAESYMIKEKAKRIKERIKYINRPGGF